MLPGLILSIRYDREKITVSISVDSENVKFPNVVVYSDDFVYDQSSDKWFTPNDMKKNVVTVKNINREGARYLLQSFWNEGHQYVDYDAKLVWKSVNF